MPDCFQVEVIIGSKSDQDMIEPCLKVLDQLGIVYRVSVYSCHRHEDKLNGFLSMIADANPDNRTQVVIAAAGMSAGLPGKVASTIKGNGIVVIGVALPSDEYLSAMDALLAITRMPPGVPLVCSGSGKAGVINAALVAADILVKAGVLGVRVLADYYVKQDKKKPSQRGLVIGPRRAEP